MKGHGEECRKAQTEELFIVVCSLVAFAKKATPKLKLDVAAFSSSASDEGGVDLILYVPVDTVQVRQFRSLAEMPLYKLPAFQHSVLPLSIHSRT